MRATLSETPRADLALYARLDAVGQAVAELELRLQGDPARQKLSEPDVPSIGDRLWAIRFGHWQTRQMPTATQRRDLDIAKAGLDAGAPWTPGRRIDRRQRE